MTEDNQPVAVRVRATVALPGLHANQVVWADPSAPFVAMCLRYGYVIEVEDPVEAAQDGE